MQKTILKEAVVLLIIAILVLPTITVMADTNKGIKGSSIDIELHVWDGENAEWVDADTESEAHNMPIGVEGVIRLFVANNGDSNLHSVGIDSVMNDGLVFLEADPPPDEYRYNPPEYICVWNIGDLSVGENFQVWLNFRVDGPECSYHYNLGQGYGLDPNGIFIDDTDWVYVHPYKKSRIFQSPFLDFLNNHLHLLPIIRLILGL